MTVHELTAKWRREAAEYPVATDARAHAAAVAVRLCADELDAALRAAPPADRRINTRCPSCGSATLFVDDHGHLVCSLIGCKEPVVSRAIDALKAAPPADAGARDRLRAFVRHHAPGGCKVLSAASCECPLCDIDRLSADAGAPPALVALVREWQAARKPTVLATPGEFLAETFKAAVRRMSAADEALAAYRLDVAEAETPAAGKRVQTPNEAEMLRALSDALTGGNASTWEQVLHAAEQHRSESGAPVVPEGATTNAPLVADMLAASLHAQAVKSRGECPTCGGLWPCDRCTTRAVDLDALKRNLDLAAETVETCAICGKSLSTVLRAWDDALLCEACAEPSVPVSAVEGMTVAGARAFWRWKDEAVAHEQLRADVMTIYSDPHLTWEQARVKLAHALAAPPADAGAPPALVAKYAREVLERFEADEAQGFHSKDRQYAIEMLRMGFGPPTPPGRTGGARRERR